MSSHEDLHYELDMTDAMMAGPGKPLKPLRADYCSEAELAEAQWNFHMEQWLMTRSPRLSVPSLQTDGLIFLWVTGRAMELGPEGYFRKLSAKFRYHVISIYMKFGALGEEQVTGSTIAKSILSNWNQRKPEVNRNIDTDLIVTEVREISRKRDMSILIHNMYAMLERIMPRARKLKLFARMHNAHAGWLSLGNQLSGVLLINEGLRARI
ncbi:N6-adenosine-methyltransferase MT-A70-like [Raphanus sativus]|nr:N6-adenosine-methyltransferase MT-A70-like [Raphanus sativus]